MRYDSRRDRLLAVMGTGVYITFYPTCLGIPGVDFIFEHSPPFYPFPSPSTHDCVGWLLVVSCQHTPWHLQRLCWPPASSPCCKQA